MFIAVNETTLVDYYANYIPYNHMIYIYKYIYNEIKGRDRTGLVRWLSLVCVCLVEPAADSRSV